MADLGIAIVVIVGFRAVLGMWWQAAIIAGAVIVLSLSYRMISKWVLRGIE